MGALKMGIEEKEWKYKLICKAPKKARESYAKFYEQRIVYQEGDAYIRD